MVPIGRIFVQALALFGVLGLAMPTLAAEAPEMIIRNVQIYDPSEEPNIRSVDIQILKGRVAHISDDQIHAEEGMPVKDANDGYLLGKLEVGLAPKFVIVDDNPLENFDVLRDTLGHTTFSIDGEQVIIDYLAESSEIVRPGQVVDRWFAYNPLPVVVDDSIVFDEKWNAFDTEHFTALFSAGLFLDRANWMSQNAASRDQVGDLNDYDGGTIRAFRFGLNGQIHFARPWTYSFWIATNSFDSEFDTHETDDFSWFDYRLDVPLTDHVTLSVGKQKEPISLARLMTLTWNPMQERAAAENAMMASRNIGVTLSGRAFDERVTWAGGVYNNWIDSGESFSDNARQFTGRFTWLPMISEDESNLIHLGLSVRYDEATQGLRYNSVPEVRDAPLFVDTGLFDADSATLLNLEAGWRKGPLWIQGELTRNEIDAPDLGNPTFSGYHIVGSWTVTGEMRPYNRRGGIFGPLPVARDVDHGGHGAVELALRWSDIDLTSGAIDGGEMQVARAAATWWATSTFNVSMNYQWIWNEIDGGKGRADGFVLRAMIFTK
jgi:phosphate-selective porin OprO/OprP